MFHAPGKNTIPGASSLASCPGIPIGRSSTVILALRANAHDLAERLLFHACEERFDDAELHVRLEQRQPHFAKGDVDILLGQLRETCEAVLGGFEALGECVKHGEGLSTS